MANMSLIIINNYLIIDLICCKNESKTNLSLNMVLLTDIFILYIEKREKVINDLLNFLSHALCDFRIKCQNCIQK